MSDLQYFDSVDELAGWNLGQAVASGNVKVIRERFATQGVDQYGRPTKQLSERFVVEGRPQGWVVVPAPSVQRHLPRPRNPLAILLSWVVEAARRVFIAALSAVAVLVLLPVCVFGMYELWDRSAGGALIGFGTWCLFLMLLLFSPRG